MEASDRIALVDVEGQLAVVAPGGGVAVLLTTGEALFQFPAWSPDNRWLALIGGNEEASGVFLTPATPEAKPSQSKPLFRSNVQPPVYLSWSPDGTLISVLAVHPDFRLALYLLGLAQSAAEPLPSPVFGGQPCFWHWHADSRGLLAHVDLGHRSAQLTHVRWRTPTHPSIQPIDIQPGYFQAPAISHDGRQLAYAQLNRMGESQLVVASRERKSIIGEHNGVTALNWSPRGEQLAFIHPLTATQHFYGPLHLWQAEHEQVRRLSAETVIAFFWAPDGVQIAYFTVVADNSTAQQDVPTGTTNGHVPASWPFLLAEESRRLQIELHIADIVTGADRPIAKFVPSRPFLNQYLPFFDQYAKSHSLWSPRSDALVLPAEVDGRPVIVVVDLKEEQIRPVAEGVMATWSW